MGKPMVVRNDVFLPESRETGRRGGRGDVAKPQAETPRWFVAEGVLVIAGV